MRVCPQEGSPLFQEVSKWSGDVGKAWNEGSLVSEDPQGRSYLFEGSQFSWPLFQAFDFDGVNMDSFAADNDSQVVDFFLFEFALGGSEEVRFFLQFVQYL